LLKITDPRATAIEDVRLIEQFFSIFRPPATITPEYLKIKF